MSNSVQPSSGSNSDSEIDPLPSSRLEKINEGEEDFEEIINLVNYVKLCNQVLGDNVNENTSIKSKKRSIQEYKNMNMDTAKVRLLTLLTNFNKNLFKIMNNDNNALAIYYGKFTTNLSELYGYLKNPEELYKNSKKISDLQQSIESWSKMIEEIAKYKEILGTDLIQTLRDFHKEALEICSSISSPVLTK
ncbi:MAG: hypothetical protein L0207_05465 [Chlamydiae bacterium]|nr:hypothetical protein [Chlamydiota bacterium]